MKRARIDKIDEKTHRVMLGDHEIGTSKTSFDAQFHVNAINDALDETFEEGRDAVTIGLEVLADIIEKETKPTIVTSNGGRCKKCGGTTTYTRQNSASGECFSCEHGLKTPPSKSDGGASFI